MPPSSSLNRRKFAAGPDASATAAAELSRHLVRAQEEERKRISRELHDGTGQGLMALRLYLAMLASESQSPESLAKIQEALKLLDLTVEDVRRIIGRLSPRILEEMGLLAAIRKEVRDLGRNAGIKAELDFPPHLGHIDRETEVAIFRSLQEALHNVAKHSRATQVTVRLKTGDGLVCLIVEDDGVGFSRNRKPGAQAFGIRGMRERIAALGGKVRIQSVEGKGTQVKIALPHPLGAARKQGSVERRLSPIRGNRAHAPESDQATRPRRLVIIR